MKKRTLFTAGAVLFAISACASFHTMAAQESTAESAVVLADTSDLFTKRDLKQEADLAGAPRFTVQDNEDITISHEGVYVISGAASNVTIYVDANDQNKVQLVLDGLEITNDERPCIFVKEADKVFVTVSADSSLSVTGKFVTEEESDADAVIFSKQDLILNGTATLTVSSTANGVVCSDDLKITGGTYLIDAQVKALSANDSIRIADGNFTLNAGTDALHAENSKDDEKGYIYIGSGTFSIHSGDDAVHGLSFIQIDGGTFDITAREGMEATYVQLNGGEIRIHATDDGINAGRKSDAYDPVFEMNDAVLTIETGAGDTDGIDSNGDIVVNAGTIDITASNAFDCDGEAVYNGGTIIVNGQVCDSIPLKQN